MKQFLAVLFVTIAATLPGEEWQRVEDFDFSTEEGFVWLVLEDGQACLMIFNYIDGRARTGDSSLSVIIDREVLPRGQVAFRAWDDEDEPTSLPLTDRGVNGISYDANAVEFYGRLFEVFLMFISRSDNVAFELTLASGDTHELVFDLPENTRSEVTWLGQAGRRYIIEERKQLREELGSYGRRDDKRFHPSKQPFV